MAAAGARVAIAVAAAAVVVDVRVGAVGAGFGPEVAAVLAFVRVPAAVPAVPAIEIEVPPARRRPLAKAGW